jgi:hypothetical protein
MIELMTPGVSGLRLFSQRRMVNYYKTILAIEIYEPQSLSHQALLLLAV